MASSALVNVADNAELTLLSLLCEGLSETERTKLETEAAALFSEGDAAGLIHCVLLSQDYILEVLLNDNEGVAAFSLFVGLWDKCEEDGVAAKYSSQVSAKIEEISAGKVLTKMQFLEALYLARTDASEKAFLLTDILKLASGGLSQTGDQLEQEKDQISSFVESLLNIDRAAPSTHSLLNVNNLTALFDSWDGSLSKEEQRRVYAALATVLSDLSLKEESQNMMLSQLATYENSADIDDEGVAVARKVAVGAIRNPVTLFSEDFEILKLPAIMSLNSSPSTQPLWSLLQIFANGQLSDFQKFASSNAKTLAENGLDEEECTSYMRVLSLCTLASDSNELPYKLVASTLDVNEREIEKWVIKARSAGLLDAKMDQVNEVVIVQKAVVRKFGLDQWKSLQNKLNIWKENLRGILSNLQELEKQ